MRIPLNPLGILLGHVLPAALLAFLFYDMLAVVQPLLGPEHLHQWWTYAAWLAGGTVVSAVYAVVLMRNRGQVHFLYGILVFLLYVPLLFGFMEHLHDMLPSEIPRWMIPDDAELYPIRLLSIPLVHSLFVLVAASLPEGDRGKPLRDLLIAAAIPLLCYLFVQVIEPWRWDIDFERHLWVVLGVVMVVVFLFFVFRGVGALVRRAGPGSSTMGWLLRFLVALVLPLIGLGVNNGLFRTWDEANGIFGDLSHWGFYVIAVLNGAAVLWPSSGNASVRLLQFVLRGIGFSYVAYFFVLFLPLLPLSIVAIVAFGLGFLLLAPVLLFIVQGLQLTQDIRFLLVSRRTAGRSRVSIAFILVASFAVLPGIITLRNLHHKYVLQSALDHVYHADPLALDIPTVDTTALHNVLDHIEVNKARSWSQRNTPFLTSYYNRIVLDNLSLGEKKLADLRSIFFDDLPPEETRTRWNQPAPRAALDTARATSTYDAQQQAWRTWVDLRMHNANESQSEYVTTFDLPEGAWICDEYLMIAGEKVKGILAEKKAAEWVYRQIVNVRRDPSITRYVAPGRVQVRVFPFAAQETREAGFEVLHKEPFTLAIDSTLLVLGDTLHAPPTAPITTPDEAITYIPSALKAALPIVQRGSEIHMILNGTEAQRGHREEVIRVVDTFIAQRGLDPKKVQVSIADAYVDAFVWSDNGADRFRHHAGQGGFFSDRAIRRIIVEACAHPGPTTPLIVIVPSQASHDPSSYGTWLEDLEDVAQCLPEGGTFLVLNENQMPSRRAFREPSRSMHAGPVELDVPVVRVWPDRLHGGPKAYLRNDGLASIIVDHDRRIEADDIHERSWADALSLEGRWRAYQLRPDGGSTAWRSLVRGSFQAQVMMPVTAWMCLEDDAQRNALLKKQEEVLNADQALDAGDEDITSMSEPDLLWLLLPVLGWFFMRRRKA